MTTVEGLKAQKELCGQIVTLSTTLLVFTVTFADKFGRVAKDGPIAVPLVLQLAWLAYFVAILFGVWTTMAIVGTMSANDANPAAKPPGEGNIKVPAVLMLGAFLIGLILTAGAGGGMVG